MEKKIDTTIGIVGTGMFGRALATLCISNDKKVVFYKRPSRIDPTSSASIESAFSGMASLQPISESISSNHELFIFAIPMQEIESCLHSIFANNKISPETIFLLTSKGIDKRRKMLSSQLFENISNNQYRYAVLSGPNFASQIINKSLSITSIATKEIEIYQTITDTLNTEYFFCKHTTNVLGLQICGAIKNIIAITIAILHHLNCFTNTISFAMQKGIDLIKTLCDIYSISADILTEPGGFADIYLTSTSGESRNSTIGKEIGNWLSAHNSLDGFPRDAIDTTTIEGIHTIKALAELLSFRKIDSPFISAMYNLIFLNSSKDAFLTDILR